MASNYSLYAIPAYWVLSLFPHGYAVALIKKANNNKWDNVNPRGAKTNPSYEKSVPADCYARFERAEAAHKNSMENAPFFVGAVLAANMAGVGARTMNAATGVYIALRLLYTVLYINTTERKTSVLRSLTWGASVLTVMGLYVKAGKEWASR
ncbi:hypothetical protein DE146DRAFT_650993 [Phaeosphaeria sp. MPI-PUGE-AT-0046c]|nr:hypothetical protein DE146DRAFT_650993 [Phaeosphaeria sp. MPI-PUGE-AT-0046c]